MKELMNYDCINIEIMLFENIVEKIKDNEKIYDGIQEKIFIILFIILYQMLLKNVYL